MYSNKDLRKLLIPLIIEQILNALMGIADTLMVSNVSAEALSGVSLVDAVNNLMIMMISALSAGGTVVCAQHLGRGNDSEAKRAAGQVLLTCLLVSLFPALLCTTLTRPLLSLVYPNLDRAVMADAAVYFFITALSYPFLGAHQAVTAVLRAEGETKRPMLVNFGANLLNVAGNAVLIFGFHLGVRGAALSTLISRIVSTAVMLCLIRHPGRKLSVRTLRQLLPSGKLIRQILRIGIPAGFENGLFQFGKLVVASTVATLGTDAIAAHAMVQLVEGIHGYPGGAIGIGLMTVAGTCMGAGRVDEVRKYTKKLCGIAELSMLIMAALIAVFLKPITLVAALTPAAEKLFIDMMILALFVKSIFWVPAFTLPNSLRAVGDATYTSTVSAVSMWTFRAGLSFLLCRVFHVGLIGVWIGWYMDWLCRDAFYIARYYSGKWTTKKVID